MRRIKSSIEEDKIVGSTKNGISLIVGFFGKTTVYLGNLRLPRERKQIALTPKQMIKLADALLHAAGETEMRKEQQRKSQIKR